MVFDLLICVLFKISEIKMLSIIVSWRDRPEIKRSIESMIEVVSALNGELILVNYGGDVDYLLSAKKGNKNVKIVNYPTDAYFHKTKAQNLGAYFASNEVLFFCDCDIILEENYLRNIVKKLSGDKKYFATLLGVKETIPNSREAKNVIEFGYELHIKVANGNTLSIIDNEENAISGTRQAPGLLLVSKGNFVKINGYNGRLNGWGWEDQDMISRLTLGLGLIREKEGVALHISHNNESRTKHYPIQDQWESRDKMFRQALSYYDENDFKGTFDIDTKNLENIINIC
jgi:predicted glycosyltransferase involved in capsule biosynthesis